MKKRIFLMLCIFRATTLYTYDLTPTCCTTFYYLLINAATSFGLSCWPPSRSSCVLCHVQARRQLTWQKLYIYMMKIIVTNMNIKILKISLWYLIFITTFIIYVEFLPSKLTHNPYISKNLRTAWSWPTAKAETCRRIN